MVSHETKSSELCIAFKEWAVVCLALASGRQSLILRKGGIAEVGGEFRPEHNRFLLYPTHFHEQQRLGIKTEFLTLLDETEAERPPFGVVRLSHWAEVMAVRFAEKWDDVLALDSEHIWSEETVRQRFAYRKPGLYVLNVSVRPLPTPVEIGETPEYAGCKTWVQLAESVPISDAGNDQVSR
jgi:hypothetical protein